MLGRYGVEGPEMQRRLHWLLRQIGYGRSREEPCATCGEYIQEEHGKDKPFKVYCKICGGQLCSECGPSPCENCEVE